MPLHAMLRPSPDRPAGQTAARAALAFALLLTAAGCHGQQLSEGARPAVPAGAAAAAPGSLVRREGAECLMNRDGIQAKVLVIEEGVRCLSESPPPPHGAPVGSPLAYFRPYFLFDAFPRDGAASHYLIGPTMQRRDVIGWVPAAAVARWDTRVGARAVRDPARRVPPVVIYPTKEALVELLQKGATAVKPIARARPQPGRAYMPWPIVEIHRALVRGQVHELVRLHFLAELKDNLAEADAPEAAQAARAGVHLQEALQKVRRLDLVFVVDCTGSMQPYIEAVKATIRDVAQQLLQGDANRRPDVAFALVAYRDHDDAATTFVTRHFGLDRDAEAFLSKLKGLDATAGGDEPEALYDGVWAGLTETPFRQGSHKVVVVVADSSAHEPGDRQNPRNIGQETLTQAARDRQRRAKVFGMITGRADQSDDKRLLWKQLTGLAQKTGGECYPLSGADQLVARVRAVLETERKETDARQDVVLAVARGQKDPARLARDTGLDVRKVTEILEFLPGAGIDLTKLRPGVPTFSSGWALCEQNGLTVLQREVYLPREDLGLLIHGMSGLITVTSHPNLGVQVFRRGVEGRTNLFGEFFQQQDRVEPLDVYLAARGIPCRRASILQLERGKLETMNEDERARLRERLAAQIELLIRDHNDSDLWLSRSGKDFGWIPEDHLP
jgi:Mg-chelatase subunit ChlD